MTSRTIGAVSAAALAAALAGPAAAVTAPEVWEDFKANVILANPDAVTVGAEDYANGVLTVTDLAVDVVGEDGSTLTTTLAAVTLTENADGTVTVTVPDEQTIAIASPADGSTTDLVLRQPGLQLVVDGEVGAFSYALSAPRYEVALVGSTQNGTPVDATATFALNELAGTYDTKGAAGADRTLAFDLSTASADLQVAGTNPDDGSTFDVTAQMQALATRGSIAMPAGLDMAAPDAAMTPGFAVDLTYAIGATTVAADVADATGPTSIQASAEGGDVALTLADGALAYTTTTRGLSVDVSGAQMPFPVQASLAEYGVNALVPLAATGGPADWALGLNLSDLVLNEEVWALFDPQAQIPRDPATVVLDLTGTATLTSDLTDPAMQAMGTSPGEVNSVTINDLTLSVGGASVTGTGAFTLDNSDLTTFPGIPRPEGSAEFQIDGLNGLIDTLVAMGLIPEDQVMGARMFLGLLAVPVGEDQLESRIEVTADGQLLANGQRLQ